MVNVWISRIKIAVPIRKAKASHKWGLLLYPALTSGMRSYASHLWAKNVPLARFLHARTVFKEIRIPANTIRLSGNKCLIKKEILYPYVPNPLFIRPWFYIVSDNDDFPEGVGNPDQRSGLLFSFVRILYR